MSNVCKQINFILWSILVSLGGLIILPSQVLAHDAHDHCARTTTANVVALDQVLIHNRMGAFSPGGMVFALRRDVVDDNIPPNPIGSVEDARNRLMAGHSFHLRPGKRPRPIVLRMNEHECMTISFQNLLKPDLSDDEQSRTRSASVHVEGLEMVGSIDDGGTYVGKNAKAVAEPGEVGTYKYHAPAHSEAGYLMTSSVVVGGEGDGGNIAMGLFGSINVEPAGAQYYRSQLTRQELDWSLDYSNASGLDNEGALVDDGYGNMVDAPDGHYDSTGHPIINYEAIYPPEAGSEKAGLPIINMMAGADAITGVGGAEYVHSDMRAIITGPGRGDFTQWMAFNSVLTPNGYKPDGVTPFGAQAQPEDAPINPDGVQAKQVRPRQEPFREFSIIFHDEVFAIQAYPDKFNDPVLGHTLHCCRDAFGIGYSIGGIGSEILANRNGQGPQWDCVECKYEEFFLTSWVLGDPGMVVDVPANASDPKASSGPKIATKAFFPDDPSNVEHSYIGDHVKMRNIHAGPKEHHIFHLHSHQWVFQPDDDNSAYLDSQFVGPGSSYTYDIAYNGSGNRNQTPGDAIFHCHFYPHFAQGMWELWRNHDVFEEGTPMNADGTVQAGTRALPDGDIVAGTPIPAIVPIPTLAMAPMPAPVTVEAKVVALPVIGEDEYGDPVEVSATREIGSNMDLSALGTPGPDGITISPGYPFIIAGEIGHRPPNPALDHAVIAGVVQDGGLHDPNDSADCNDADETTICNSRHVILGGTVAEVHTNRLDMRKISGTLEAKWFPETGSPAEQIGMDFHAQRAHVSVTPEGNPLLYVTNGLGPVSGAPFADPCVDDFGNALGGPGTTADGNIVPERLYKAADIQLDIVINKLGEHYPQARTIALWGDVASYLDKSRAPEPLFFRANSRDCIEYWQTNLIPEEYELDDFQVRTPTDTVGQHIHLVKFDVTAADGSGNGWNYEDAAFSYGEVVERIHAVNAFNDISAPGTPHLTPRPHPFFEGFDGAVTVVQRWYADETMNMTGQDRTLRTVYTHDHYGPSTHQQVGLYAGLLIEPDDSVWKDMVTGEVMGDRFDGGPTSWRANIITNDTCGDDAHANCTTTRNSYREFMFEFADFALAYAPGPLGMDINEGGTVINAADNFVNRQLAVNPPAKETIGLPFVLKKAPVCPGGAPIPCPEGVSADDPGTFVTNYRSEPVIHRVLNKNPQPNPDVDDYPYFNTVTFPGVGDTDHDDDGNIDLADVDVEPYKDEVEGFPGTGDTDHDEDGNIDLADVDVAPLKGTVHTFPGDGDTDVDGDGMVDPLDGDIDVAPLKDEVEGFPGIGDTDHDGDGDVDLADVDVAPLKGTIYTFPGDGDTDHDGDGNVDLADTDVYPFINTVTFPEPGSDDIDHNGDGFVNASDTESADCHNPSDYTQPNGCQSAGLAGDLGHVFRSDVERANPFLNTALGNTPYPPLTGGIRPGDPFTPLMQAYENDRIQFRFMVGAHEEGHVETIYGAKWLMEPNAKESGWRSGQAAAISEHFEFEIQSLGAVKNGPFYDQFYTFDTSSDGAATGPWGLIRVYDGPDSLEGVDGELQLLPNNPKGKTPGGGKDVENHREFAGVCPKDAPERKFSVYAVRAIDVITPEAGMPAGLIYNSRLGAFADHHPGPLHDPTALMYVYANDMQNGKLKAGVPVEPLVLRAAAGECIFVTLTNMFGEGAMDDLDAFNVVPMLVEKFNLNQVEVSSEVGLHPQLVTYDVGDYEGANIGMNVAFGGKRTAAPGEKITYKWYAGDVQVVDNPDYDEDCEPSGKGKNKTSCALPSYKRATPIEFGATNLVPVDPLEHSAKGLIGSLIIEPRNSWWETDYDLGINDRTRSSATVTYPELDEYGDPVLVDGEPTYNPKNGKPILDENGNPVYTQVQVFHSFREFVLQFQDDIQLRDANGAPICPVAGAAEEEGAEEPEGEEGPGGDVHVEEAVDAVFECAGPEDPEDSGNKAVNYKTEPAWFRKGVDPGAPLGHLRLVDYTDLLSNSVTDVHGDPAIHPGESPDPQTPIFTATVGDEVRMRILQSGGHPRNHVMVVHGHTWQRSPYKSLDWDHDGEANVVGSEIIGDNYQSSIHSSQEGHGPQNHFDILFNNDAGGSLNVPGDYLWRNQASFQFDAGHWGLLRVLPEPAP